MSEFPGDSGDGRDRTRDLLNANLDYGHQWA
jgi:hypothetical protein